MDLSVPFIVYTAVNIIVACVYVYDKIKAVCDGWRISERALLTLSLFGPFGAAAAMISTHHKTSKPVFKTVYLFLIVHIAIIAALLCSQP